MADPTEPFDNGVWETYSLKAGQADARLLITDTGESVLLSRGGYRACISHKRNIALEYVNKVEGGVPAAVLRF